MNEEYIANAERRRKIADDMAWSSGHAAGRAAERARYAALDVERAEAYFETRKPQTDDTRLAKSLPEPPRPLSAEDEALVRTAPPSAARCGSWCSPASPWSWPC